MKAFSKLASPSGFFLVLLLFLFLPFVSVACDAGSADYSGANLATGARPDVEIAPGLEDMAKDVAGPAGTDQMPAAGAQVLAFIVIILLVAGIVLPFLPRLASQVRYRMLGGAGLAVLAGVLLIVTQDVAQSNIAARLADISRGLPGSGQTPGEDDIADRFVRSEVGFWLSLVVLVVVVLVSVGYVYQDKIFTRPVAARATARSSARASARTSERTSEPIWRAESPEPGEPAETPPPTGPGAPTEPPAPVGPAAPPEPPAPAGPEAPPEPPAPTEQPG
jgi:hypothetical protein